MGLLVVKSWLFKYINAKTQLTYEPFISFQLKWHAKRCKFIIHQPLLPKPQIAEMIKTRRRTYFRGRGGTRLESILKIINNLAALGMQRETADRLTPLSPSLPLKHPLVSTSIPSLGQLKHGRVIFYFFLLQQKKKKKRNVSRWPCPVAHGARVLRGGGGAVPGADKDVTATRLAPLSGKFLCFPNKGVKMKEHNSFSLRFTPQE